MNKIQAMQIFNYYAQQWFYCWAFSSQQAANIIRRRVSALIGRFNLSKPVLVEPDDK